MKSAFKHRARCCNPFGVKGHRKNLSKELRVVTHALKLLYPDLPLNELICGTCRLKINTISEQKKVQESDLKVDGGTPAVNTEFDGGEPSTSAYSSIERQQFTQKCSQESVVTSSQHSDCILTGQSVSSLSLDENSVSTPGEVSDNNVAIEQINGVLGSLNLPSLKRISHLSDSYILSVFNDVHEAFKSKLEIIRPSNGTSNPSYLSSNMVIFICI